MVPSELTGVFIHTIEYELERHYCIHYPKILEFNQDVVTFYLKLKQAQEKQGNGQFLLSNEWVLQLAEISWQWTFSLLKNNEPAILNLFEEGDTQLEKSNLTWKKLI